MPAKPSRWKHIVEDYFTLAKYQRRAIFIFLLLTILVAFVPAIYRIGVAEKSRKASNLIVSTSEKLIAEEEANNKPYTNYYKRDYADNRTGKSSEPAGELFAFDPNTVSVEEWIRLGVREKTAHTIQNYLSKGGHFYKPGDLRKVYGLREEQVNRLLPYVSIAAKPKSAFSTSDKKDFAEQPTTKAGFSAAMVDINQADTSAFIALPGIGSKLANRIVNYREKLGGFYTINQLGETYGLADSTFQKLKPRLTVSGGIRQININTATATELKMPYLSYNLVNAIIQYRTQHGNFQKIEDIKKIVLVDDALYTKIAPYLKVE